MNIYIRYFLISALVTISLPNSLCCITEKVMILKKLTGHLKNKKIVALFDIHESYALDKALAATIEKQQIEYPLLTNNSRLLYQARIDKNTIPQSQTFFNLLNKMYTYDDTDENYLINIESRIYDSLWKRPNLPKNITHDDLQEAQKEEHTTLKILLKKMYKKHRMTKYFNDNFESLKKSYQCSTSFYMKEYNRDKDFIENVMMPSYMADVNALITILSSDKHDIITMGSRHLENIIPLLITRFGFADISESKHNIPLKDDSGNDILVPFNSSNIKPIDLSHISMDD